MQRAVVLAQVILESFFGANTGFTAGTEAPGVGPRTFASFRQAAEEAGQSRILGGIHFQFDNQAGLAAGRGVAGYGLQAFAVVTAFCGGILLVPSLTHSIFSGSSGESILGTRVPLGGVLRRR